MMKLSEELHRWSFSSEKGLPPLVIHLKHWEEDAAALEAEVARFQETVAAYERLKETLNHGPYRSWQERCEVAESEVARLQALVDAAHKDQGTLLWLRQQSIEGHCVRWFSERNYWGSYLEKCPRTDGKALVDAPEESAAPAALRDPVADDHAADAMAYALYCLGASRSKLDANLLEELAAVAHSSWSHWMSYLFNKCTPIPGGGVVIPSNLAERWRRQCRTEYNDLSKDEKESDREEARRYMAVLAGTNTAAPAEPEPAVPVTCGCGDEGWVWVETLQSWTPPNHWPKGYPQALFCGTCHYRCNADGTVTPPAAAPSEEPIKPGPGVADLAKVMREAEAAYAPSQGALSDEALDRLREIARDEIKDHGAGFLYAHDAPEYASARGTLQVDASYPAVGAPPGDPGAEWRRLDAMVSYWKEKRDCPHIGDSHFQLREGNRQAFQEERDRHQRPPDAAPATDATGGEGTCPE